MILEFLNSYWREILEVVVLLTTIILWIIRKKPVKVVDTLKEVIVRVLPALINSAELSGLSGPDKLSLVVNNLAIVLKDLGYGDDLISQYLPFAKEQVELILSTPQKKVR